MPLSLSPANNQCPSLSPANNQCPLSPANNQCPLSLSPANNQCPPSLSVQVNLDFESEADMVEKMRIGLALQPVATALFANSPFRDGRPNGYQVRVRVKVNG